MSAAKCDPPECLGLNWWAALPCPKRDESDHPMEKTMTESARIKYLRIALIAVGVIFTFGIWPLTIVWPSGWAWHEGSPATSDYFLMIVGVYATLGVFMIMAAKRPEVNASLIWFVVWSSIVHALIMAWESLRNPMMRGHLAGDVPILLVVAIVLGLLMSRSRAMSATVAL